MTGDGNRKVYLGDGMSAHHVWMAEGSTPTVGFVRTPRDTAFDKEPLE